MAQKPLEPFKSSIVPYAKVIEIESGVITRMYWHHPTHEEDFSDRINDIEEIWDEQWPEENHLMISFLKARRFHRIIVDKRIAYPI